MAAQVVGQTVANSSAMPQGGTLAAALLSSQGKTNPSNHAAPMAAPAIGSPVAQPMPGYSPTAGMPGYPTTSPATSTAIGPSPAASPRREAMADSEPPTPTIRVAVRRGDASDVQSAMREDARLHDVCFVDTQSGWAVGDRGTIWHTQDGGSHWYPQSSGVDCSLHSVTFLDQQNGCVVGGFSHPHTHTGTGVVLLTRDGGRTWQPSPQPLLPILKRVGFFNEKQGWAIGDGSAASPSGLFVTQNGGRSWNPMPGAKGPGWAAGDFLAPFDGALVAQDGSASEVRKGRISSSATPRFGLRGPQAVRLVPPYYGWLVGEGGLAMLTRDLGHTWQTPPAPLAPSVAIHFDFHALCVRNTKVWIAGSPGTRIFHTADAGLSWHTFDTAQTAPLRALHFADDRHGWAVGDFGTILATVDGGQTWKRQHNGGTRAALMAVFADGSNLPLELFAKLSGNEGYLSVAEIVGRQNLEQIPPNRVAAIDRVHEAVVALGGCGAQRAWRFPLQADVLKLQADAVVEHWDRVNDGYGNLMLEAHLVRQIRTYRPEVVVTHGASPTGDDPLGDVLNRAVLSAVHRAADPTVHSDQITQAGLQPWTVTRVFSTMPPGLTGTTTVSTSQLAARLGRSLADAASGPRGLIDSEMTPAAETLGFRLLVDQRSDHGGKEDFFTGIMLAPGGEARRQLAEPPPGSLDRIRQMARQRRNTRAILKQASDDSPRQMGLLAQTGDLTRGLDDDMAAAVLHQMAQAYFTTGRWSMAATMFERLVNNHPTHPLSRSAYRWLVHYYASDEAAWRVHGSQRLTQNHTATRAIDPNKLAEDLQAATRDADETGLYAVKQASAQSVDSTQLEDRAERAARFGKMIRQTLPDLHAEPSVGFPLAVVDRRRGYPVQAERFLMVLQRSSTHDSWWACAQGERWMTDPVGVPPKEVVNCVMAPTKPHLDGKLDDAAWQRAKPARLSDGPGAGGDQPATEVLLAYDPNFLYIGLRCPKVEGVSYSGVRGIRPRDPDLTDRDRVELFLDLDRDFATYYRLTIDHRGYVGESCWGDPSWNPTWFVAAGEGREMWTAEAAIPLDQLTGKYPTSRNVWAIGARRIIPGVGIQSWSANHADQIHPEDFGYLIFD